MFDIVKKKKEKTYFLSAPVAGTTISLFEVKDPVFSEEILGKGIGIIPTDGNIYAPESGRVESISETLHALTIRTAYGADILLHFGLDTVKMKGEGFKVYVKAGSKIKKGSILFSADLKKIRSHGFDPTFIMVICNTFEFASVKVRNGIKVTPGESIIYLKTPDIKLSV